MLALRDLQDIRGYHPYHIYYQLKLFTLVCTGEQGEACEKLNHDAAHAPHIDTLRVWEYS